MVQLQDEFGNGVAGADVTFGVTEGGGAENPATVATGADGTAQTTWTMGPAVGPAALTAAATGFSPLAFTATAVLPTPDLVVGAISVSPASPTTLETVTVTVPVTNDGTLTTGVSFQVQLLVDGVEAATQTIEPIAPALTEDVAFTTGPFAAGTRTVSVVADASGAVAESDENNNTAVKSVPVAAETALMVGMPITNVGAAMGVELLFGFQFPVADGLSIEFELAGGTGDADLCVHRGARPPSRDDYECISGFTTDCNESCRFEAALTGTYHVLLHAHSTFSGTTVSVTTGLEVLPYNIDLVFINSGSSLQNAAVDSAAARWERILSLDVSNVSFVLFTVPANECVDGQPTIRGRVDDIRI